MTHIDHYDPHATFTRGSTWRGRYVATPNDRQAAIDRYSGGYPLLGQYTWEVQDCDCAIAARTPEPPHDSTTWHPPQPEDGWWTLAEHRCLSLAHGYSEDEARHRSDRLADAMHRLVVA